MKFLIHYFSLYYRDAVTCLFFPAFLLFGNRQRRFEYLLTWYFAVNVLLIFCIALVQYLYYNNQWMVGIHDFTLMLMSILIYRELFVNHPKEKRALFLFAVPTLLYIAYPVITNNLQITNVYFCLTQGVLIAGFAFFYLKRFVEERDENPLNDYAFWFCLATLIDNVVSMPYNGLLSTVAWTHPELFDKIDFIVQIDDVIWISLIVGGFIWTRRAQI